MAHSTLNPPLGRSATVKAPPATPALTPVGLAVLLIGVFLPLTDFFIVNVALPTIDRDLHASAGVLQLVVAGYGTAYAVLLVLGGRLGDAVGRRRLFLAGMAAFTLTSLACGLAPTASLLVAFRVLQGASAALMLPQVLSTIQATTEGPERARALGLYGATGGVATVIGQLLGGVLVSANIAGSGWRPIFLLNVPFGLLGLALATRVLPESRSSAPAAVDRRGTVLLGVALVALLVPLTEGRSLGWPVWTLVLLAVSPVAAFAFLRSERRLETAGGTPLLPLSILRVTSLRRGLMIGVPFFCGFGAFMFVYALALQDGAGESALRTGISLLPMAFGFMAASLTMSRLVERLGRTLLTMGAGLQFIGLLAIAAALMASWPHPDFWILAPGALLTGLGNGWVLPPLFRLVLSEVPLPLAGVGSGVLVTTQQTSLAVGVATVGSAYLTLSPITHLGALHATLIVLAALVVIAAIVGIGSRLLPD